MFNDPDTEKELLLIMNVFQTFDQKKQLEFIETLVNMKKTDSRMKKRIALWARLVKPRIQQMNHIESVKVVLSQLLDQKLKLNKRTKTINEIRKQFYAFKTTESKSSKLKSSTSTKKINIKFTKLKLFKDYDTYDKCIEKKTFRKLEISIGSKKIIVLITLAQAYLLNLVKDSIKIVTLENYGFGAIWGVLDSYVDFSSEKSIQRLVRAKQKKSIDYQKEDLLKDRIHLVKSSFRDLGLSFSGKSGFKTDCIVEKEELLDFS